MLAYNIGKSVIPGNTAAVAQARGSWILVKFWGFVRDGAPDIMGILKEPSTNPKLKFFKFRHDC